MKYLKIVAGCIISILFITNVSLSGDLKRMPIMGKDDLKKKTVVQFRELWLSKLDKLLERDVIEIVGLDGSKQKMGTRSEPTDKETFVITKEVVESLGYDFEKTIICYILTNDTYQLNTAIDDFMLRILQISRNMAEFGVAEGLLSKETLRAKEIVEPIKVSTEPDDIICLEGLIECMKTNDVLTKDQVKKCIQKKLPKITKAKFDEFINHLTDRYSLSDSLTESVFVDNQKNTVEIVKPEALIHQYDLVKEFIVMKQKYK